MVDSEVEELQEPFDVIIRGFRQKAQDLEEKGLSDEAQKFYLNANKIKEIKEDIMH